MKIYTETELVNELAKGLKKPFNTDVAVTEMSAGYGIVDLVFAKNFLSKSNNLNRKPLNNYLSLKAFLKLNEEEFTLDDVMQITGSSIYQSKKIIAQLLEDNYIVKTEKLKFKKNIYLKNPIKKIVAIEAKLKDWKSGILQARRYKSFTDECYLAILSEYEKNIQYKYLTEFGIGLILYDQNTGTINLKLKPTENKFISIYEETKSVFAKELFLSAAIKI